MGLNPVQSLTFYQDIFSSCVMVVFMEKGPVKVKHVAKEDKYNIPGQGVNTGHLIQIQVH